MIRDKIPRTLDEAFGPGARLDVERETDYFKPALLLVGFVAFAFALCLIPY